MTSARAVAIDLGAGSGRVVDAQYQDGRLALREVHRFPTPAGRDDATGYECWDLDLIEAQVAHGVKLAQTPGPVQSLGIDAWGVDYVLLDGERQRVGPAVSYRDGRTAGVMPGVFARMPAEQIYQRTGIQFMPLNTLFQLTQTAQAHPDWVARTRQVLMLPGYLNYRLCGVLANEYTNATTTQLYGLEQDGWDSGLLALAGLEPAQMAELVEPGTVLGETDQHLGGQPALVIAPATHDTASAIAAIPFEDDNEVFLSSGTWSLMGFESLTPYTGPAALRCNFSSEGGVERRYGVQKSLVGLWMAQQIALEAQLDHGALAEAANVAEPWVSLLDPRDPRFLNPPSMSAAIRAFCAETGQPAPAGPGSLARCVFESLALSYRSVQGEIEALRGRPVSTIRIVGGGSQNHLLNQLCADACQVPVQAGPAETSAIGNACVQFLARGVFKSLAEARDIVRRSYPAAPYRPSDFVPERAWKQFQSFKPGQP